MSIVNFPDNYEARAFQSDRTSDDGRLDESGFNNSYNKELNPATENPTSGLIIRNYHCKLLTKIPSHSFLQIPLCFNVIEKHDNTLSRFQ